MNTDLTVAGLEVHGTAGADSLTGLSGFTNELYGEAGADTLTGGALADVLVGGTGNDQLLGGAGNDEYRYLQGDGYDTLTDTGGMDTLVLADLVDTDAIFYRVGNDLEVALAGGQGVLVKNQFASVGAPTVDFTLFASSSLTAADLANRAMPRP